jgi:hypothetical protein
MCENWIQSKALRFHQETIHRRDEAPVLIERVLFLDGSPSMQPWVDGWGSVKLCRGDLGLELGAVKQYNDYIATATKEGDNGSRISCDPAQRRKGYVDSRSPNAPDQKVGYERYLTCRWEKRGRIDAKFPKPHFAWRCEKGQQIPSCRTEIYHCNRQQLRATNHISSGGVAVSSTLDSPLTIIWLPRCHHDVHH